ncbi:hypothetical protein BCR39DRAFT_504192 [Naematelia encephala]|uniref:Uncharacterized protein n=1 Tax=Naematelia encephala TaxID=71784 RepID=A0A1Y2BDF9_9TREE|nr:hypothetical protein BCR39DRAFT_504192 [Naematelia encephala]
MTDLIPFTDESTLISVLSSAGLSEQDRDLIVSGFKNGDISVSLTDGRTKEISVYPPPGLDLFIVETARGEGESEGNVESHGSNEGELSNPDGGSSRGEGTYRVQHFGQGDGKWRLYAHGNLSSATRVEVDKSHKSFACQSEWDPQLWQERPEPSSGSDSGDEVNHEDEVEIEEVDQAGNNDGSLKGKGNGDDTMTDMGPLRTTQHGLPSAESKNTAAWDTRATESDV